MTFQGKVLNWNDVKGFGFVEPNAGRVRAFVHIKAFKPQSRRPISGDVITYELVPEKNNRYKATKIQFARDRKRLNKSSNTNNSGNTFGIYFTFIFGVVSIFQFSHNRQTVNLRTAQVMLHRLLNVPIFVYLTS